MVSKARDDFPEPERPVKTISFSRGSSNERLRRLCSRAPRITSLSDTSMRLPVGGGVRISESAARAPIRAGRGHRRWRSGIEYAQRVAGPLDVGGWDRLADP